MYVLTR